MAEPVTRPAMAEAYPIIRPHVRRTPVIEIDLHDLDPSIEPRPVLLKLEQLQVAGSFKARGAFANLLLREVPASGVVAASGGNHGVAVAYAAHRLRARASIFVPTVSAPAKVQRIRGLGADLVVGGDRYADALAAAETFQCGCWPNRPERWVGGAGVPGRTGRPPVRGSRS